MGVTDADDARSDNPSFSSASSSLQIVTRAKKWKKKARKKKEGGTKKPMFIQSLGQIAGGRNLA